MLKKILTNIRLVISGTKTTSTTHNLVIFNAGKLAGLYSIILIIGLITLSMLLIFKFTPLLEKQASYLSEALIFQSAYSLKTPLLTNNNSEIKMLLTDLNEKESVIGVTLYNKDYSLALSKGFKLQQINFPLETEAYTVQTISLETSLITIKTITTYTIVVNYDALIFGYLSVSFEQKFISEFQQEILQALIAVILLGLAVCFLVTFYISKFVNKPLNKLINTNSALSSNSKNYLGNNNLESFNELDKNFLQKDKVEAIFSRYVSPQVAKEVLNDLDSLAEVELGGEHLAASVFFADIVGFTSLSEMLDPQEVSDLLNVYFSKITEAVSFCCGYVDKFIGDCAMVVFGVPIKKEHHAFDCIACAWMVLQLVDELNRKREAEGKLRVEFCIGANSGMMLAGNMGSNERMEYTVVGDSVNLASRLCGSAEPGELIITEDVFIEQNLDGLIGVDDKDFIKLRGKKVPIKTLVVNDILTPFKQKILDEITLIINRCEND